MFELVGTFIVAMLMPVAILRTILYFISRPISEIAVHTREGKKFHHLHFGIGILAIGILAFLVLGVTTYSAGLAGVGFGMVIDEFVPSLYIPEPEPFTTATYWKTLRATVLLVAGVVACFLGVLLLIRLLA